MLRLATKLVMSCYGGARKLIQQTSTELVACCPLPASPAPKPSFWKSPFNTLVPSPHPERTRFLPASVLILPRGRPCFLPLNGVLYLPPHPLPIPQAFWSPARRQSSSSRNGVQFGSPISLEGLETEHVHGQRQEGVPNSGNNTYI